MHEGTGNHDTGSPGFSGKTSAVLNGVDIAVDNNRNISRRRNSRLQAFHSAGGGESQGFRLLRSVDAEEGSSLLPVPAGMAVDPKILPPKKGCVVDLPPHQTAEKKGGKIIVNGQRIDPMPVITGTAQYPENIAEKIAEKADIKVIDALSLARDAGNIKAVNVVLIGVMAKSTDIAYDKWIETIKSTVPEKFLDINLKAFDLGYNI